MLLHMGIYEQDVEHIIEVIGDDYDDVFELKKRLQHSYDKLHKISYLSRYVINSFV